LLERFVAIISFWRRIWSRENLPEAPAGAGTGAQTELGFSFRALLAQDILPPPKPSSRPARRFSFRALMAREVLPLSVGDAPPTRSFSFHALVAREVLPPRPEHPGRRRGLLGFLVARETLPRPTQDTGGEPINEHRE